MKSNDSINCLISIIIAVYNSQDYLVECLDSILNQTYKNIEIILINDGSTDKSGEISREYERTYKNIKYIYANNGGAARARNTGIKIAKGDYIAIVDSDDYVHEKHIEQLAKNAINSQSNISVCNYYVQKKNISVLRNNKPNVLLFSNTEAIRDHLLESSILEPMICNKLFKRSLFTENNLWFPEGQMYEDSRNLYKLYYYANNIIFENNPTYYYRQRQGSVMNHGIRKENINMLQNIATEAEEWLSKKNVYLPRELEAYQLTGYINCLNYMVDNNKIYKNEWDEIISKIILNKKSYLDNPLVSNKRKLTIKYIGFGPRYYKIIRRFYKLKKVTNK